MPRYGGSRSLPGFYPGGPDGPSQRCGIQEKEQFGEDGDSCWGQVEIQVFEGPPGGPWVYRYGAGREVLPGERFLSSQQVGGDKTVSMDNIPWERVCTMRNEKRA